MKLETYRSFCDTVGQLIQSAAGPLKDTLVDASYTLDFLRKTPVLGRLLLVDCFLITASCSS
jgi:hypothetical protein